MADLAPAARLTAPPPAGAPDRRRADLDRLAGERWDVLVVGGGIVGCGVLLDAASRGLRAALVEQEDIASGASSRSSRLIHGGARSVPPLRLPLVREALSERSRLLRLAPHLVRLEPLLSPVYGAPALRRALDGAGVLLHDLLGGRRDAGWAGHLTAEQALEWSPRLGQDGLRGGIVVHDAVVDDARMTLAVLRTALAAGATAVTRVRATGALMARGRVDGVAAQDRLGGGPLDVRASTVVDATGAWATVGRDPFGREPRVASHLVGHILVPRARIPAVGGMTVPDARGRLTLLPWDGHWIVGATEGERSGAPDRATVTREEVDELLARLNRILEAGLTRDDVVGTYAGLHRTPWDAARGSTSRPHHEHRVDDRVDGLVRVSGGTYGTYRVMARRAIDAALRDTGGAPRSPTANVPLHGALARASLDALAARLGSEELDARAARTLVARHGSGAEGVVALGRDLGLLDRLTHEADQLEVEVVHAVREELALSLDDVLARRMRLALGLRDRGVSIAPRVAELMGRELGWDEARRTAEVDRYVRRAETEYGVPT